MTDAGEKLEQRFFRFLRDIQHRFGTALDREEVFGLVRAELERAAVIADISGETVIAAAIRKLKE